VTGGSIDSFRPFSCRYCWYSCCHYFGQCFSLFYAPFCTILYNFYLYFPSKSCGNEQTTGSSLFSNIVRCYRQIV